MVKRKQRFFTLIAPAALSIAVLWGSSPASAAPIVSLGTASTFAILAGQTVTNSGDSIVNGNIGIFPGATITGFGPGPGQLGPGIVNGTQYLGGSATGPAGTAQGDLTAAYNALAGLACGITLTGQDLGSLAPLNPGVYCFTTDAQLTGTLVLNEHGLDNQEFVFQIASALTTAVNAAIIAINPGPTNGGANNNIFWLVGSSATLGTGTAFLGNIVALTSISLGAGARITCGAALARNGSVTLLDNAITTNATCEADGANIVPDPATGPTPGSLSLLGLGFFGLTGIAIGRRRNRRC
jgi:hypothetical protein